MRHALSLVFVVLACTAAPLADARALPPAVVQQLSRAGVPVEAVAAVVEPVEGGPRLVSHQAGVGVHPASVMKLLTTYAALDLLGPTFTFRTDALIAGELRNGVLSGDLVLRGGGDPKLTYEKLWQMLRHLRARGLREIQGDVLIDRSYFAPVTHDAALFDGEPRRAYNVGPDALLVNFHAVDFRFVPGDDGLRVTGEPDLPNVEIVSNVQLTKDACGWWRGGLQYDVRENGMLATVTFSGNYPAACGERTWPLAVFAPPRYAESVFRWLWSEAGGVLRGKVRPGTAPATARLFYRHESEPLANLVRETNKFSNNVMARHLFLALSAEKASSAGEAAASARVLRDWLKAKGIEAPEVVTANGSGLSRVDRASADTIAAVLRSAWASPVMPELAASLPIFALDGTLRQRQGGVAAGRAHLKGGTLSGVQAVAGYVLDARGRRWIVVMVVNHANAGAAQPALDALVQWVHRSTASRKTP